MPISLGQDGFAANPKAIVVSPFMEDQTNFLQKFVSAGSIGEDKALDLKIEKGECPAHGVFIARVLTRKWSVSKVSWKNQTFV